ncbi:carbohydrate-binding module family 20 domain-containing protein [Streptomyces sp. NPDC058739]|uniref:carbohydrate-binding module family 20 domain-containing protein n=1 Tax=Streptomyces sp. NPDC058739 TaxID=3346618 RepID=UPI003686A734
MKALNAVSQTSHPDREGSHMNHFRWSAPRRLMGGLLTGAALVASCVGGSTASAAQGDQTAVAFTVTATSVWGEDVFVTGNVPELGSWNPDKAVPLSASDYPRWGASATLPANTPIEFKYLIKRPNGSISWEVGDNRALTTPPRGSFTSLDTFRFTPDVPASGTAPACIVSNTSWRYAMAGNTCRTAYPLQTVHQSGARSACREVLPGTTATFPGHGTSYDYVVAFAHC